MGSLIDNRIGFLGVGKMGEGILAALLKQFPGSSKNIVICDSDVVRLAEIERRHGVTAESDPLKLADNCDILFLAIKPQDLDEALLALARRLSARHLLISIAAGKRLERLRQLAGDTPRLARVMPNLNVVVGEGMSVFAMEDHPLTDDRELIKQLLAACGSVCELPESMFDAVTALSGSGPAFFAQYLLAMVEAAVVLGLPREEATLLAAQTMLGTGRYLRDTGTGAQEFIDAVSSPNGTTAAGMKALRESNLNEIVSAALRAATERGKELNQN